MGEPADRHDAALRLDGDTGANLVEYSLLMALIFLVCLSAVTLFGDRSTGKMSCVSSAIVSESTGARC